MKELRHALKTNLNLLLEDTEQDAVVHGDISRRGKYNMSYYDFKNKTNKKVEHK